MTHPRYSKLIDPLINYTCDKLNETNTQKLGFVRLVYEIIREAIADLHNSKVKSHQIDAALYFNSPLFDFHCSCVCISKKLMLYIANNPEKHLQKIGKYNLEILDESINEFEELS